MKRSKLVLLSFSTLAVSIFIQGCAKTVNSGTSTCVPVVEKIPVKCEVPKVPRANLEQIHMSDSPDVKLEKLIHNYGELQRNNFLLRQAIKVCQ